MRPTHYASLDWLRGTAALLVFALHAAAGTPAMAVFSRAYLAVDLFFVISGVVVAASYEDMMRRPGGALAVARRRWVRLYPMVVLGAGLGVGAWAAGQVPSRHPLLLLATHLLFVPNAWYGWTLFLLNGPQWSLLLEVAGNAGHALAVRWLSARVLAGIVTAGAAGLVTAACRYGTLDVGWGAPNWAGGVARLAFGYTAGVLLFRWRGAGERRRRALPGWAVAGLPLLLLAPALAPDRWYVDPIAVAAMPVAVALALDATLPPLLHRAGRALGRLSYPLYAIHWPLLAIAGALPGGRGGPGRIAVATAVLFVAGLATRWYDEPVRRRLAARLGVASPRAPAATAP